MPSLFYSVYRHCSTKLVYLTNFLNNGRSFNKGGQDSAYIVWEKKIKVWKRDVSQEGLWHEVQYYLEGSESLVATRSSSLSLSDMSTIMTVTLSVHPLFTASTASLLQASS